MAHHTSDAIPDIVVITVQYGNFADTAGLAASLAEVHESDKCELVVVDNDTSPQTADMEALQRKAPFPVRVLRPLQNLFYWGGADFALRSLYGSKGPFPRWVIVCNNDVTIGDPDFLQNLLSMNPQTHPIVAPSIISLAAGRDQNPILRDPAGPLKRLKWRIYDIDYRIARTLLAVHGTAKRLSGAMPRRRSRTPTRKSDQKVYAPHGAFMILSSAFFERGGVLDTTVPMFAEELTIAALAQRLGLPVWYCPGLQVFHREHSTTGANLTRAKYEMERMARRHYFGLLIDAPK